MNVAPDTVFEAVLETGETGGAGVYRLRIIDNDGGTTQAASSADIAEVAFGVYSAERTSPSTRGQYTLVWDDGTDDGVLAVEELNVTSTASLPPDFTGDNYATVDELFRILKIRNPSVEQEAAGERVLATAAGEIRAEVDLEEGDELEGWQLALAAEVNLERAVEHWRQQEAPFGLIGLGPEMGASFTARDSWERHAFKLAPLKAQWGLA